MLSIKAVKGTRERVISSPSSMIGDDSIKPLTISVKSEIDPSGLLCDIQSEALRPRKLTISVKTSGTIVPPSPERWD